MTPAHALFAMPVAPTRRWLPRLAVLLAGLLLLIGTGRAEQRLIADSRVAGVADADAKPARPKELRMWMTAGTRRFAVTLADTDAARAFAARLPMTLEMTELNGNEKKFDLPQALPANPSRPGSIRNGDLMLYGANTVVVFYLSFDSAYAYTRLGRVDDPAGLAHALGKGSVRVEFSRP